MQRLVVNGEPDAKLLARAEAGLASGLTVGLAVPPQCTLGSTDEDGQFLRFAHPSSVGEDVPIPALRYGGSELSGADFVMSAKLKVATGTASLSIACGSEEGSISIPVSPEGRITVTGSVFELPSDAAKGPPEAPRGQLCDWIVTRRGCELACYGAGRLLAVGACASTEGSLALSLAPGGPAAALHLYAWAVEFVEPPSPPPLTWGGQRPVASAVKARNTCMPPASTGSPRSPRIQFSEQPGKANMASKAKLRVGEKAAAKMAAAEESAAWEAQLAARREKRAERLAALDAAAKAKRARNRSVDEQEAMALQQQASDKVASDREATLALAAAASEAKALRDAFTKFAREAEATRAQAMVTVFTAAQKALAAEIGSRERILEQQHAVAQAAGASQARAVEAMRAGQQELSVRLADALEPVAAVQLDETGHRALRTRVDDALDAAREYQQQLDINPALATDAALADICVYCRQGAVTAATHVELPTGRRCHTTCHPVYVARLALSRAPPCTYCLKPLLANLPSSPGVSAAPDDVAAMMTVEVNGQEMHAGCVSMAAAAVAKRCAVCRGPIQRGAMATKPNGDVCHADCSPHYSCDADRPP
jgi:hypothetical protein